MPRTIVSISAAPGWAARISTDGEEKVVTLLAWALVEDGADRNLVGLVQRAEGVGFADEVDGFDSYTVGALRTRSVDA